MAILKSKSARKTISVNGYCPGIYFKPTFEQAMYQQLCKKLLVFCYGNGLLFHVAIVATPHDSISHVYVGELFVDRQRIASGLSIVIADIDRNISRYLDDSGHA